MTYPETDKTHPPELPPIVVVQVHPRTTPGSPEAAPERPHLLVVYKDPTPRQAWSQVRSSVSLLLWSLGRACRSYCRVVNDAYVEKNLWYRKK